MKTLGQDTGGVVFARSSGSHKNAVKALLGNGQTLELSLLSGMREAQDAFQFVAYRFLSDELFKTGDRSLNRRHFDMGVRCRRGDFRRGFPEVAGIKQELRGVC